MSKAMDRRLNWQMRPPIAVPDELRRLVGGEPLVAERLVRLGLSGEAEVKAFLEPDQYRESSPFELPDLEIGAARLATAIRGGERILIWGDFDVDGQTASALLYTALREVGANVEYHIPLRLGEGHGIYLPRLQAWLDRGIDLIVTCDTGITSHDAVELAQRSGVEMVITDHHLPGETLPPALAVINPMRLPEGHRLRDLPGVGVAYELIRGLGVLPKIEQLLDLVALGIVADVAIQRDETRYLLQRGIATMRLTERVGLQSLIEVAGLSPLEIDETAIGFSLGPRLNAQGRLGDARDGVELLTTTDRARASELASQLEGMNARRRLESRLVEESAAALLERDQSILEYAAIVLAHPDWSGGVVGIVANRLAEIHNRPVILLGEKDGVLAGSARSVAGCNVTEALRQCSELLIRFGGHTMAAGLSLRTTDLFEFRRRFSIAVRKMRAGIDDRPILEIDGKVGFDRLSLEFAGELGRLGPFGNGNPPLTLVTSGLRLVRKKALGRRGDHLELQLEDREGRRQRAIWWKAGKAEIPSDRFSLAWRLSISRFEQTPEVLLEVIDLQADEPVEIRNGAPTSPDAESGRPVTEDLRHDPDPHLRLAELIGLYPLAIVWSEGDSTVSGCRRHELTPAPVLIIWTAPPGPSELNSALERVKPERVILFHQPSAAVSLEIFLQRLGGLLKFIIGKRDGRTTVEELAGALAQRASAVGYGLEWFASNGQISLERRRNGQVQVERGANGRTETQPAIEDLLRATLDETAAYRRNARRANPLTTPAVIDDTPPADN
jgi:single-stranded-DNA-specific exonuclease